MEKKKDALAALRAYADKKPSRSEGAEEAARLTGRLYGAEGTARGRGALALARRPALLALLAAALALTAALLFAFFYGGKKKEPMYFEDSSIYTETIEDIGQFQQENGLSLSLFEGDLLGSKYIAVRYIEDGRLLYVRQTAAALTAEGLDTITLSICISEGHFPGFNVFTQLDQTMQVGGIEAAYGQDSMDENTFYAKFTAGGFVYCLKLVTFGDAQALESYIAQLL